MALLGVNASSGCGRLMVQIGWLGLSVGGRHVP